LKPGDFYFYDDYTLSAFRNYGLAQARGVYVFKYYRDLGYRRAIGVVALENKVGLGTASALGCCAIGLYGCIRFGPWQWDWKEALSEEPLPILTKKIQRLSECLEIS
jgi:hypothetical protein